MHWKRAIFTFCAAATGFAILALYRNAAFPERASGEDAVVAAPAPMEQPFVTIVDPAKGPKDADILIVEFGDHACPYCRSSQDAIDRLMDAHPGKIRLVWKSAPSPLHPGADVAAEAALCAGQQGRFWDFHAKVFAESAPLNQASMTIVANDLGLEELAFAECLGRGQTRPLVERTVMEARALGLTVIPTTFIDGIRYEGALTYDQLLEATGL